MATVFTHESQDIDDQAKSLKGWEQSYEQLGRGRFRGSVWQLEMRGGVLLRETGNRQHRQQFVPPLGQVVLAMSLAVDPGSVFNGRPIGRDSLVVFNSRAQHDFISSGENELIVLAVDSAVLEAALAPDKLDWLERKALERHVELPPETATAIRCMLLAACDVGHTRVGAEKERAFDRVLQHRALLRRAEVGHRGQPALALRHRHRRAVAAEGVVPEGLVGDFAVR